MPVRERKSGGVGGGGGGDVWIKCFREFCRICVLDEGFRGFVNICERWAREGK